MLGAIGKAGKSGGGGVNAGGLGDLLGGVLGGGGGGLGGMLGGLLGGGNDDAKPATHAAPATDKAAAGKGGGGLLDKAKGMIDTNKDGKVEAKELEEPGQEPRPEAAAGQAQAPLEFLDATASGLLVVRGGMVPSRRAAVTTTIVDYGVSDASTSLAAVNRSLAMTVRSSGGAPIPKPAGATRDGGQEFTQLEGGAGSTRPPR